MRRRDLLKLGAAAVTARAAPRVLRGETAQVLKFVPLTDLSVLDPIWARVRMTHNHGYMVFDTLYGLDESYGPQPQMVEAHEIAEDGLRWALKLRQGLRFHDGTPVLGRDVVASIGRWAIRDAFGQGLVAATEELSAPSDRLVEFRLKRRFPHLPQALAGASTNMPCIMPERLARTDPYTQVTEMVGSGPYRFLPGERVAGSRAVYERFADYVPRNGTEPSFTAGPKIAHFDRIEWLTIADATTASAALQSGEVDWWEMPTHDLVPTLSRDRRVTVEITETSGLMAVMKINHLQPPFDNPAVRRALLGAIDQAEAMTAVAGTDRAWWRDSIGLPDPPLDEQRDNRQGRMECLFHFLRRLCLLQSLRQWRVTGERLIGRLAGKPADRGVARRLARRRGPCCGATHRPRAAAAGLARRALHPDGSAAPADGPSQRLGRLAARLSAVLRCAPSMT
jgi:peptide/nickel transport system substrate-binding protein